MSERILEARFGEHHRKGLSLQGCQASLLADVLRSGVVDVQIKVAAIQVPGEHDGLASTELL